MRRVGASHRRYIVQRGVADRDDGGVDVQGPFGLSFG